MLVFGFIGITLISLLIIFLLIKKGKLTNDWILLGLLICFLVNLFVPILFNQNDQFPIRSLLLEVTNIFMLALGPMLLFYTHSLIDLSFRFRRIHLYHFTPSIVLLLLILSFRYLRSDLSSIRVILTAFIFIVIFAYLTGCIRLLVKHNENIKAIFSNTKNKDLKWLMFLLISIMVLWTVGVISSLVLTEWLQYQIPMHGSWYTNFGASFFAIALGFLGLQQKIVFDQKNPVPNFVSSSESNVQTKSKYLKTGLDTKTADIHYQKLKKIMEAQKPFLDPDLTLYKLSKLLELKPNQLSQVINSNAKVNFFEFVNSYRINEFITNLKSKDSAQYTLLALALASGFNSKSSFNRAFKNITGKTPSAYRKELDT